MAKTQSRNIMTIAQSEFTEVIAIIRLHRSSALQAVNTEHVTMCWEIGKYISSHIQSGKWGDKVVEGLADYIHCADPTAKGFSKRNLYNMVRFYETYSTPQFMEESSHYQLDKILQTASAQITPQPVAQIETPSAAIMQTPSAQMPVCLTMTTFSNHLEIMGHCKTMQERIFYMVYSRVENLQTRELRRVISSDTFTTLLARHKNMSDALRQAYPNAPLMLKDRLYLDFLNLPQRHKENQLHNGLLNYMKDFILEMGKEDFVFMGSEYPLQVGSNTYHLDLLFFHRPLQCMVAIELKAGAFQPKDLGQLEFYMEALDRQVKRSNENPTIGILLCQTAEQMVVEYALSRSMSPTMVAEYKSRLIPSEVLQQTLTAYIEQTNH